MMKGQHMKIIKNILWWLLTVLILLPILLYTGIVIANNCIADSIEKDLRAIELPENTRLVESVSIAGKMFGNGNGMQYIGVILVESDMSPEELEEYYMTHGKSVGEYISVRKQDNPDWLGVHTFQHFDGAGNYYAIDCMKANMSHYIDSGFIRELLDMDLRGH